MSFEKLKIKAMVLTLMVAAQQSSICWAQEIALAGNTAQSPELSLSSNTTELPILSVASSSIPSPINNADATLRGSISSDPTEAVNQVDELTRQILLKIVQLERFNIHYSMEVARQGRWKGWRYAGFQEVNAGMGLAGSIIGTANRGYHLHSSSHVWTAVQENACFIPMIGSIIGASAAALEMAINEYHDLEATSRGFAPKAARKYVQDTVNEINALMDRRDALLKVESTSSTLAGHVSVDTIEGKILDDLRDQSILEFERFHVGARKLLAFQQAQYMFDITKYTLNAIGYDFAYLSLHRHHRIWNYRAGVFFTISGAFFMGGPILSRLIGKGVGEYHKHFLKPLTEDIHERSVQTLQSDENSLVQVTQSVPAPSITSAIERKEIYNLQDKKFSDEISSGLKSRANAKLSATQNIGAGLFVGATKIAQGVLFIVPGYYTAYNTKTLTANRITNTDLFIASVIGIPQTAFSMVDTFRIQVRGEINRHKMLAAGTHPKQVAERRLKELDDIEAKLKKGHS